MKEVTVYILIFSLLLHICSALKLKGKRNAGKKNSNVGHLIKTHSGKIYLRRPSRKKALSTTDTKKNPSERDFRTNRQGLTPQKYYGTDDVTDYTTSPSTSGCAGVQRVRKNVNSLDDEEQQKLRTAMEAFIKSGGYEDLANFHGGPPIICNDTISKTRLGTVTDGFCCPHSYPTFLPWHRLFMAQMEEELGEALPYWDWTENPKLPKLWEHSKEFKIRAPIKEGEVSFCGGGQFVTRTVIEIPLTENLKNQTREAFTQEDFMSFEDSVASPHGLVHKMVGCDMLKPATAAYDTIFYLHHSYVDYQWAYWQELQRLRGHPEPVDEGLKDPLPPFDNSKFNQQDKTFRNHRGKDTFDYRKKFCYQYDQLMFDGKTPEEFLQSLKNPDSSETISIGAFAEDAAAEEKELGPDVDAFKKMFKSGAHEEQKPAPSISSGPRGKVFVGVVLPREAESGENVFKLCQNEECVEGGRLGTFGVASSSSGDYSEPQIDEKNYFLRESDVTALIKKQGWTLGKPLVARMEESVVDNLPEPVVIVKQMGNGGKLGKGKVILNPKEKRHNYGNLLDKYS